MTSALLISLCNDGVSCELVSTRIVELGEYRELEKSLGMVMGGNTSWMFGTNVSLTSAVMRQDFPTPG